jgi:hypothetical protein
MTEQHRHNWYRDPGEQDSLIKLNESISDINWKRNLYREVQSIKNTVQWIKCDLQAIKILIKFR